MNSCAVGHASRPMKIGDEITYNGKQWILRGLDPMGVPDRRVELEDPDTGERVFVPLADALPDEV